MNKRGQFYLIAGMILVIVIIGLISITNSSSMENHSKVEKYGRELKIESQKTLDYDLNNNANAIENLTQLYSGYIGNDIDSYFILGTNSSLEAYTYISGIKIDASENLSTSNGRITFIQGNTAYRFDLNKGTNFYFILSQEIDGARFVYIN